MNTGVVGRHNFQTAVYTETSIAIYGLPVYAGSVLSGNDPVFGGLSTLDDFALFAKKLRGQFSIIVRKGREIFAITDFGCSRPVYYLWDQDRAEYRVTSRLEELNAHSVGKLSEAGVFFLHNPRRTRNPADVFGY